MKVPWEENLNPPTQETRQTPNMRLVNYSQTNEERSEKYHLVISCGGTCLDAQKMRDWRLSKIERFYHLTETYNPSTKEYGREFNSVQPLALDTGQEPARGTTVGVWRDYKPSIGESAGVAVAFSYHWQQS